MFDRELLKEDIMNLRLGLLILAAFLFFLAVLVGLGHITAKEGAALIPGGLLLWVLAEIFSSRPQP